MECRKKGAGRRKCSRVFVTCMRNCSGGRVSIRWNLLIFYFTDQDSEFSASGVNSILLLYVSFILRFFYSITRIFRFL